MLLLDLDLSKASDRIPRTFTLALLRHMGLPSELLGALRGWHAKANFRYKYRTGHGRPWTTTNGFPQGCCLSCVIMNALVATWLAILKSAALPEGVRMHLAAYADDQKITMLAAKRNLGCLDEALQQMAALSAEWAEDTDQGYNGHKSQLWVSHPSLQQHYEGRLTIQGQQVPTATTITHLGRTSQLPIPPESGW